MTPRSAPEQPVQIGPQGLFGLYHPPAGDAAKGAVLLCPPLGQDQIRSHRLYRQLAHALAEAGYAVLRYDCHGTGDSPGDSGEVDWQRCIADTTLAADELRRRSGCSQLIAYGARLGGSLALAAAAQAGFARLLVWDPVLDGAPHVAQLDAWQERLRQDKERFAKPRPASAASGQWLGFAIAPALRAQLAALRFATLAAPVDLLQSADVDEPGAERLLAAGARRIALTAPSPWLDYERLETTVLAPEMIRAVGTLLQEAR